MPAAKYFLDTNILIYTVGNVIPQKKIAVDLIGSLAVISTQIVTESINVMYRKLGYDYAEIRSIVDTFIDQMAIYPITTDMIHSRYAAPSPCPLSQRARGNEAGMLQVFPSPSGRGGRGEGA